MEAFCKTVEETKRVAAELAATLTGGELVLLKGELGAGKTAFAQGLAQALGADFARSPTFTVMNVYRTAHPSIREMVHLDFYRLKPGEAHALGLEDWLGRPDAVVAAEWPPEALPVPPGTRVVLVSIRGDQAGRAITIEKTAA